SENDQANALINQWDGKLVVAGSSLIGTRNAFVLVRYYPDGSVDTNFGNEGVVTTEIGTEDDQAFALAIQPDRKLVSGGFSYIDGQYNFALVRYNNDGSLDTTFGTD